MGSLCKLTDGRFQIGPKQAEGKKNKIKLKDNILIKYNSDFFRLFFLCLQNSCKHECCILFSAGRAGKQRQTDPGKLSATA